MAKVLMKCRRCGMEFAFPVSETIFACPACDALHERPQAQQETFMGLDRANDLRAEGKYAEALSVYQDVLQRSPTAHEALWGMVLCRYGVAYVTDPATHRRMPTLHFLQRCSILKDGDYVRACKHAPGEIAAQYREDAAYIEQVHRELMQGAESFPDCDVFLCYKGSAPDGKGMAKEYEHAFRLCRHLEKYGFRVFFAHESLKKTAGARYEAGIFRALHSAKVMLVICSDPANLSTAWVHSEWSRFLKRFYEGESCRLIPLLYDNCDAYSLPQELGRLQGIDMSDPDAFEALRENLRKYVPAAEPVPAITPALPAQPADGAEVEELLTIEYALANERWEEAAMRADNLIRKKPRCSRAYLMKLLAEMKLTAPEKLATSLIAFEQETDWQWACKLAAVQEQEWLGGLLAKSHEAREQKRLADEARRAERKRRAEEKQREEERLRRYAELRRAERQREEEAERQRKEEERLLAEAERQREQCRIEEELRAAAEKRFEEELRRLGEMANEAQRRARHRRFILALLTIPVMLYGVVVLEHYFPEQANLIDIGMAVTALVVLRLLSWLAAMRVRRELRKEEEDEYWEIGS